METMDSIVDSIKVFDQIQTVQINENPGLPEARLFQVSYLVEFNCGYSNKNQVDYFIFLQKEVELYYNHKQAELLTNSFYIIYTNANANANVNELEDRIESTIKDNKISAECILELQFEDKMLEYESENKIVNRIYINNIPVHILLNLNYSKYSPILNIIIKSVELYYKNLINRYGIKVQIQREQIYREDLYEKERDNIQVKGKDENINTNDKQLNNIINKTQLRDRMNMHYNYNYEQSQDYKAKFNYNNIDTCQNYIKELTSRIHLHIGFEFDLLEKSDLEVIFEQVVLTLEGSFKEFQSTYAEYLFDGETFKRIYWERVCKQRLIEDFYYFYLIENERNKMNYTENDIFQMINNNVN